MINDGACPYRRLPRPSLRSGLAMTIVFALLQLSPAFAATDWRQREKMSTLVEQGQKPLTSVSYFQPKPAVVVRPLVKPGTITLEDALHTPLFVPIAQEPPRQGALRAQKP